VLLGEARNSISAMNTRVCEPLLVELAHKSGSTTQFKHLFRPHSDSYVLGMANSSTFVTRQFIRKRRNDLQMLLARLIDRCSVHRLPSLRAPQVLIGDARWIDVGNLLGLTWIKTWPLGFEISDVEARLEW
jgi:hypothetical protein